MARETDLTAQEEALINDLLGDDKPDRDAQCAKLAEVRNALGYQPTQDGPAIREWIDACREEYRSTGNRFCGL